MQRISLEVDRQSYVRTCIVPVHQMSETEITALLFPLPQVPNLLSCWFFFLNPSHGEIKSFLPYKKRLFLGINNGGREDIKLLN